MASIQGSLGNISLFSGSVCVALEFSVGWQGLGTFIATIKGWEINSWHFDTGSEGLRWEQHLAQALLVAQDCVQVVFEHL